MFKQIQFQNYKAFEGKQTFDIRPMTVIIGKNSSGKSIVTRLPLLLHNAIFNGNKDIPLDTEPYEVKLGEDFKDLIYNKYETRAINFEVRLKTTSDDLGITFSIQNIPEKNIQIIENLTIKKDKEEKISLIWNKDDVNIQHFINDNTSESYKFAFEGIVPKANKKLQKTINDWRKNLSDSAFQIKYIAPIRAEAESLYEKNMRPFFLDIKGEYIPQLLFNNNALLKKVGQWYLEHLDNWKLEIQIIKNNYFEVVFSHSSKPHVKVNFTQVGLGMSQALPLVVAAHTLKAGDLQIIEQPELHLHPSAHASLAELFAMKAKEQGAAFIVETHSENFILRLRRLIVENKLKPEDVVIYWVDNEEFEGKSILKKININKNGILDFWPEGIFSEDHEEVLAIRRAQRQNV